MEKHKHRMGARPLSDISNAIDFDPARWDVDHFHPRWVFGVWNRIANHRRGYGLGLAQGGHHNQKAGRQGQTP